MNICSLKKSSAAITLISYIFTGIIFSAPAAEAGVPLAAEKKASKFSLVDDSAETRGTEYVMRQYPGEKLMAIRILAGVRLPGIYYVPEGTDLLTAVAISGGLLATADATKVRWNHWATQEHQILNLEDTVAEPKSRNPALGANDVVMIDEVKPWISNNTVLLVSIIASVFGIFVGAKALAK